MQKNLPGYAPATIRTAGRPTQDGKRVVHYPVCDDRETLLWFANQRAVEYHPTLFRELASDAPTHLVVDLDPPAGSDAFAQAVQAPSWCDRRSATRHGGDGEDQRRQGRARRRAAGAGPDRDGRRRSHPRRGGARRAA
jgi:hypothetical protein